MGEIAIPLRKSNAASSTKPSTNGSGTISTPRASIPQRKRVALGPVECTAPVTTPDSRLPSAQTASISPASAVAPSSSANATVATSAPPSSAPMAKAQAISGASTRHGIGALAARLAPVRRAARCASG